MLPYKSNNESIKGYGKTKLSVSENNDCVVCSIASAFNITYNQSHKFCEENYDRKEKRGVRTYIYHKKNKEFSENNTELFGKTIKEIGDPDKNYFGEIRPHTYYGEKQCKMTVGTFIKKYNKGTFILSVSGHSFTIKDGIVIGNWSDSKKMRVRIQKAWEVK